MAFRAASKVGSLIPSSILKVVDLHALFKWGNVILHESRVAVVLEHMGETILVKVEILAVTLIDFRLEGREEGVE
jgi:hypothetical protein